jgi:integrase
MEKRARSPRRQPGESYNTAAYAHAIARAVKKANWKFIEASVELEYHIPHWHPHQLRHAHATEVRKRFGIEAAQVALGHAHVSTTEIYAERNLELGTKVAAHMG